MMPATSTCMKELQSSTKKLHEGYLENVRITMQSVHSENHNNK